MLSLVYTIGGINIDEPYTVYRWCVRVGPAQSLDRRNAEAHLDHATDTKGILLGPILSVAVDSGYRCALTGLQGPVSRAVGSAPYTQAATVPTETAPVSAHPAGKRSGQGLKGETVSGKWDTKSCTCPDRPRDRDRSVSVVVIRQREARPARRHRRQPSGSRIVPLQSRCPPPVTRHKLIPHQTTLQISKRSAPTHKPLSEYLAQSFPRARARPFPRPPCCLLKRPHAWW